MAAALRQNTATARGRLVSLSGYASEEDKRRAREAGFDEHLGKPADPVRLLEVLLEFLESNLVLLSELFQRNLLHY